MKKTIKAVSVVGLAKNQNLTVSSDEKLLEFMLSKGVKTLHDAFRLGRLDMASTILNGTTESVDVEI